MKTKTSSSLLKEYFPPTNPPSLFVLTGDWLTGYIRQIDYDKLSRLPDSFVVAGDGRRKIGIKWHSYLDYSHKGYRIMGVTEAG